jgi:hypothetical protein
MFSTNKKHLYCDSQGNYQFVMRIPADLQTVLDSKRIKRSLKTTNVKDAVIVLNGLVGKIQTSFALLRSGVLDKEQSIAVRASILPPKRTTQKNTPKTLQTLIDLYTSERSPNWMSSARFIFQCPRQVYFPV